MEEKACAKAGWEKVQVCVRNSKASNFAIREIRLEIIAWALNVNVRSLHFCFGCQWHQVLSSHLGLLTL